MLLLDSFMCDRGATVKSYFELELKTNNSSHVAHDSCAFHVTHNSCGNMIGIADQGIYNAFTSHVVIENRWCEVGRLSHK